MKRQERWTRQTDDEEQICRQKHSETQRWTNLDKQIDTYTDRHRIEQRKKTFKRHIANLSFRKPL